MKKLYTIFVLLLLATNLFAQSSGGTKVRINSDIQGGDLAKSNAELMENALFNTLKLNYPCLKFVSDDLIRTGLKQQHDLQLLGTGTDQELADFSDNAVRVDFYIFIRSIVTTDGLLTLSAVFRDPKKGEDLSSCFLTGDTHTTFDEIKKAAKRLADGLEEYEICPYEGKVTLEIESETDKTTNETMPCDNGVISIETKLKSNYTLKWELTKNGLRKGSGNVSYDMKETTETTINNPCYICSNGQKTIAQINEKKDVEAKANGLSKESVSEGQKVADCRIRLVFLEDGTYNILVEATSQKGNMKTTIDKKVNAPCAAGKDEKPEEPRNNEIEVPLKVVLGPYKGTAKDAVLSQDETKDLSQGEEKTNLKINFSLTRKE